MRGFGRGGYRREQAGAQRPDAVQFAETARDTAKAIAAGNGDKAANPQKT